MAEETPDSTTPKVARKPGAATKKPRSSTRPSPTKKASAAAPAPPPTPPAPATPSVVAGKTIVDASGLVLGRAASRIAARLLRGESIVVVHAEKSVITGARAMVFETYRANRARGSVRSGPHFPRYPDRIFRRTVRGMLPHLKTRGKEALDRLEVHIGWPPEYTGRTAEVIEDAKARPALRAPLTLEEVSRFLGARV